VSDWYLALAEAIRLNPKYAAAYHVRGMAYQCKGATRMAEVDFARARELGQKP
jgi:Tfp pilus assembly protein PilF